uniref:Uncharacterized protein n=1 Tax=Sus scrofa TaxID=9823 RepID=A0A8D1IM58_PIG
MTILTMLILPIQEHSISFNLFMSSSVSFTSALEFSEYRCCASLGRFIPRYFILFSVMINGIVSLISLSGLLLFVYRKATDTCLLICILKLPHSLMSSSSFLITYLEFSTYSIMSSTNSDSFISFPIWIPFISYLIALASYLIIASYYCYICNCSWQYNLL